MNKIFIYLSFLCSIKFDINENYYYNIKFNYAISLPDYSSLIISGISSDNSLQNSKY